MAITVTRTAPPSKPTGVTITAVHGLDKVYSEEAGGLIDRTTEFTTGVGIQFMSSDNDYIYVGLNTKRFQQGSSNIDGTWANIHVNLTIPASVSVEPTFEYSTGDNTWATLVVTDGTNGFTQNGTISFINSSYPGWTYWKSNSRDGNGNEIGDGVDRFYIRIKRTVDALVTPPTINEMGTGVLTANTTYYYKVWGMYSSGYAPGYPLRSEPSDEANGTTTTIKRSLKVEWNIAVDAERYYIMRTSTSGDYEMDSYGSGVYTSTADIDNYAQAVNCGYGYYYDVETENRDYTIDIGVPLYARSNTSTEIRSAYVNFAYFDKPRGAIVVSGGTELSPASFTDIYNQDVLSGWNTFVRNHVDWANYYIWSCYDHIKIEDYFLDKFTTLYISGYLNTFSCTSCIFGQEEDTGTTLGGLRLIYFNSSNNRPPLYFKNTKFYNCFINDDSRNDRNISRNYTPIIFYDNCELYDSAIQNELKIDIMRFDGDNIVANNFRIVNSRYGFELTSDSVSTSNITDLKIYGEYGLSTRSWETDVAVTYRDFELTDTNTPIWNYPGGSMVEGYKTTFNLVDFKFTNSDMLDSDIALYSVINIYNSLLLTVKDSTGTAIVGTSVIIKDTNGDEISGSPFTTDVNGQINPDILMSVYTTSGDTPAHSLNTYEVDQKEDYYPFTITITESGYQTYTDVFTHNANEEWEIALQLYEGIYNNNVEGSIDTEDIIGNISSDLLSSTISSSNLGGSVSSTSIEGEITTSTLNGNID